MMKLLFAAVLGVTMISSNLSSDGACPTIRDFDKRAQNGERLNVVFFGASLTWGANASDPQTTSYRGLMMQYFFSKYPKASFVFRDATIGGTGSDLGIFRLDRDVTPYHPDLVILDFTVNDGAEGKDVQHLASYERILRELLSSGTPVLPVMLCFKWHTHNLDAPLAAPRYADHAKLAAAYGCPIANVVEGVRKAVKEGKADPEILWAIDGVHPDDPGYKLFFELVRDAYEQATKSDQAIVIPEKTVFDDLYPHRQRQLLVDSALPAGWTKVETYRTSMWFDGLSSRWMGNVAAAKMGKDGKQPEPLEVKFNGSMVGLFGEKSTNTPWFEVLIDGKSIPQPRAKPDQGNFWNIGIAPPSAGNLFAWTQLANNLSDGEHTLRIVPRLKGGDPKEQLKIESVCSAGR